MYLAKITVTLRKSILDVQGKAIHHALESLSMNDAKEVRIGKYIELRLDSRTQTDAQLMAEDACKKLLANPVMEDYSFTIEKLS